MGLVLWIDQNSFATSLIEKVFKKRGLPFYTLGSVEDFSYLVDDLNPVVIVLDGETYGAHPEAFINQYENSAQMREIPFILLEPRGDLGFIRKKIGILSKPIEPFELPDMIKNILSAN